MTEISADRLPTVRRALSWALVTALCVAALTAIGSILTGDFDETDGRVIAMSLGFAVFSATAASGASLRFRDSEKLRTLGLAAMALSALSFLLLPVALWSDDDAWRWFGCTALTALACSHASLVSGASRAGDSAAVELLGTASIALAVVNSFFGILAISGAVEDVDEGLGELMAALVVLLLLTSALPPILRRIQSPAAAAASQGSGSSRSAEADATRDRRPASLSFSAEVLAAADRIEALNGDPGNQAPEIRRECARLRELARSYSR